MKISSIFVAFLENTNFKSADNPCVITNLCKVLSLTYYNPRNPNEVTYVIKDVASGVKLIQVLRRKPLIGPPRDRPTYTPY